ncbi:MAG: ABC transporter ATP-binding protein [Candidatus Dormibacteraceae bacterium]
MAPLARLERLSYWYPNSSRPALDEVDLELDGGLTLVTGDSGGGKSTLLRALNGLVPHFHGGRVSGRVEVAGLDVLRVPTREIARRVGFVFQDPEAQFVYGAVEREVAFGPENLGLPRDEMERRVEAALAAVGALGLRARSVSSLSGGEKQRVALASALAMRPRLLVLDEPTSQLDADGADDLVRACLGLAAEGSSLVIAEHRLDKLGPAADRWLAVRAGQVLAGGGPALPAGEEDPPELPRGEPAWEATGVFAGPAGTPVISDVDLRGSAGEVVAVSGPNGSGKTTLLRVLAGLLPPLAGRVERRPGRVAYLPQDPSSLLHLPSVRAEVEQTLRWCRERAPALDILGELGLARLAERYPRDLSTGERQRAALAAALVGHPLLAILDEPTRGMDAPAREALVRLVRRLAGEGTAVVLATHDSRLAAALAHRVVSLRAGRLVTAPAAVA